MILEIVYENKQNKVPIKFFSKKILSLQNLFFSFTSLIGSIFPNREFHGSTHFPLAVDIVVVSGVDIVVVSRDLCTALPL